MIRTVLMVALIGLTASLASAAPIVTPLDLNDFLLADPPTAVLIDPGGAFATLDEDTTVISTILVNDPFFGDPIIIVPGAGRLLKFEFDFVDGAAGAEFSARVFDADTLVEPPGAVFSTIVSGAGSVSLDLDIPPALLGYGMTFELASFDFFPLVDDASVTIRNLRLEDPGDDIDLSVIPEPATLALLGGATAVLAWRRRRKSADS